MRDFRRVTAMGREQPLRTLVYRQQSEKTCDRGDDLFSIDDVWVILGENSIISEGNLTYTTG